MKKKQYKPSIGPDEYDDDVMVIREKSGKSKESAESKKKKRILERRLQEDEERAEALKANKKPKKIKKVKAKKKDKEQQKSHAVALAGEQPKKRISKLNSKRLKSIMGDSAEDIQQLLESDDGDTARSVMYKRMLQSLVDLIPYAENNIRKSKGARGVYQLNSMISSVRELLVDVQAAQDRGRIGELMVERIVAPSILEVGTRIVQKFDLIQADASQRMSADDLRIFKEDLKKHRNDIADTINDSYYKMQDEIKQYLQR